MIDHTSINVSNFQNSKEFYTHALAPLGYQLLAEFDDAVARFGIDSKPDFWIGTGVVNTPRIHVAFRAENREIVRAFHEAALKLGGQDRGLPGLRSHYHANYYGAFILDPDGHNIEAVCHLPA
jgi:catechol 2,3-dioxygenase-like lactoylglutathione lyase family enzyme